MRGKLWTSFPGWLTHGNIDTDNSVKMFLLLIKRVYQTEHTWSLLAVLPQKNKSNVKTTVWQVEDSFKGRNMIRSFHPPLNIALAISFFQTSVLFTKNIFFLHLDSFFRSPSSARRVSDTVFIYKNICVCVCIYINNIYNVYTNICIYTATYFQTRHLREGNMGSCCCRTYSSLPSIIPAICYTYFSQHCENEFINIWDLRSAVLFKLSNQ